jgi:mRNA-degrading endonuclease RelE of RelBE toxin-antitoxin system
MPQDKPSIRVIRSTKITKDIKKLLKHYPLAKADLQSLADRLEAGEIVGDRISGNKYPVLKARIRNSSIRKGKSGGYRVVYYILMPAAILLITMYSNSVRENISNQEIEDIIEQDEELWAALGSAPEQSVSVELSDFETIAEIEN